MVLSAEGVLHVGNNAVERRWMSGVLQRVKNRGAFTTGKIELAWATFRDVDADDSRDLVTIGLGRDCSTLVIIQ